MKESPCILIVDDQQSEVAVLAEFLKARGYSITLAVDGFKALAACKVRLPDLILLDLQMPLMKGVDVCGRLKADEKTCHIPVILLRSTEEDAAGVTKDFADYPLLVKPLEAEDVLSLIKTMLRERGLREELRRKDTQVKELILADSVTSCRNLRYLTEFLKAELNQSVRYSSVFSLLTIEVDHHKNLLKTHGQEKFDLFLAELAVVIGRGCRKADLLARSGAAEFALAMPFTDVNGAVEVAERIRNAVEQSAFTFGDKTERSTVCLGVCQFRPEMDKEGEMLLSYARAAMSKAHEADGGNMTFVAE